MKSKIAIFINSVTVGGAERVVSLLLKELKNDLDIYLVLLSDKIEYDLPDDQKIFCFHQPENDENPILKICKLPLLAYRYKKFCQKNNIGISFSFLKRPNYINCLSRMFGSTSTVIISERSHLTGYLKSLDTSERVLGEFLTRQLYPKADLIVPNSLLTQIDLQESFHIHTRYRVINNPIDLKTILKMKFAKVENCLFEAFTFIHVGVFRREKNHDMLIEAFNMLQDLNCKLLLLGKGLGKGEEEARVKQKVQQMNLQSRVIFLGFDNNPFKYLSKSDCFVLSSDFEGFPNSVLEALACNLPVISTDCKSGPREILAPGTNIRLNIKDDLELAQYGVLVPVNNAEILAKAMRHIYKDKELAAHYRSTAMVRASYYDSSRVINDFKEILIG
jgi:N-acetylgalactosamine-N,N'-diacetylbacillosaminyl-diphospho-undecaprenol 4-alpha-N-acetylgalactosaminyltransferase